MASLSSRRFDDKKPRHAPADLTIFQQLKERATSLHRRLALLMFLQYAVPGAWVPLFPLRLDELAFTPLEIAGVYTPFALASLVAPLLAGQVADRWVPAERCMTVCSILAAGLLWLLADLTTPLAVFATCLL